jgi:hypothetical protein
LVKNDFPYAVPLPYLVGLTHSGRCEGIVGQAFRNCLNILPAAVLFAVQEAIAGKAKI